MLHVERPLRVAGTGGRLSGVRYIPVGHELGENGCIFLNPLDNEANNATRFYVQTARLLAQTGILVIRFDYCGTGNSAGSFSDVSFKTLLDDVDSIRSDVAREYQLKRICLAGARFGGTLALLAAGLRQGVEELVLWDPILDLSRELRVNFINKTLLNRKLMGDPATTAEGLQATEPKGIIELNCLPFSRAFFDELRQFSFEKLPRLQLKRGLVMIPRAGITNATRNILTALERETPLTLKILSFDRRHLGWEAEDFSAASELIPALQQPTLAFLSRHTMQGD